MLHTHCSVAQYACPAHAPCLAHALSAFSTPRCIRTAHITHSLCPNLHAPGMHASRASLALHHYLVYIFICFYSYRVVSGHGVRAMCLCATTGAAVLYRCATKHLLDFPCCSPGTLWHTARAGVGHPAVSCVARAQFPSPAVRALPVSRARACPICAHTSTNLRHVASNVPSLASSCHAHGL